MVLLKIHHHVSGAGRLGGFRGTRSAGQAGA
jgi:hypothetical protein